MTNRQTILIVEDDARWQEILKEPLEDEGWEVTVVAGYHDGRQALEEQGFDLVVLDLLLDESAPMLDGERLLAHLSRRYPGTPCIVVSGQRDIQVVRDAFKQYHVVDYIAKDGFDILTFLDAARSALRATVAPAALRRALEERFDLEEIKNLCFDLEIEFDDLRGEGKKARTLVAYCRRHGRLEELATRIARLRPGALRSQVDSKR
jgi:DNA-binding NtrC family response regulator